MESSNPKVSSKEKLKNKPKIGAGSKEEKRKQKKEKLTQALQKKEESKVQEVVYKEPEAPVTFGRDFYESLNEVMETDVSKFVRKPTKKQKAQSEVDRMKRLLANSDFMNPEAVFGHVDNIINQKSEALQIKIAEEEEKKLEQQRREKEQGDQ